MQLKNSISLLLGALVALGTSSCKNATKQTVNTKPNIIIIYADDLGYGDLSCYGATGVQTPNIDHLAKNGVRFTDAHSTASTCTPSRFSVLTGSYAFRNNAAILPGSAPLLIRPGTPTLPAMFQKNGYNTAVIGKWHLGLGDGTPTWNDQLRPGPLEIGFNYSFIVPATLDRVPTVFVENHQVVGLSTSDSLSISYDHKVGNLPTGLEHPEMTRMLADSQHSGTIIDSISRIGFMTGGKSAWWKDEDITATVVSKVKNYIHQNKQHPFFLYFAPTDVHVPRAPNARFKGASKMGPRGDAIAELDWSVGQVIDYLKKEGLADNTLIIFSSDNGPVLDDGYQDQAEALVGSDRPWGPFNGGKYSAFEAGTRMPTITYWPGHIQQTVSSTLFSHVDFYASLADLIGYKLNPGEAPDSYDMLPVIMGKSSKGRESMLEESYTLSLRAGNYKYIAPQTAAIPDWMKNKKIPTGLSKAPQLYDLSTDTAEHKNLAAIHPDIVQSMQQTITGIQQKATRPGYQNH
ncbi:Arylsulfatase A [Arachidicoccus rhizosphaerae]|jgi:arylsulfatase A-like enzyme|uniref:Arylsulfatase A n=1 Tax=Arachidicoccus rhizosphaerae TaxID=551991 RepID=A0A1H3Y3N0_9BACT|nr:arylsulfatase [Arachidicoccus rhizosphaerae]SEA05418.1 Arylsulfatase A [Arachidicoccus rhizosphaerae]